jgi:hypothetical protein
MMPVSMEDKTRIPRWVVENDPLWVKSVDSDLGMLRWTNRNTGAHAVCPPAGLFCEILEDETTGVGLTDVGSLARRMNAGRTNGADDIRKYLASGHLNPAANWPAGLDRSKLRRF